MLMKPNVLQRGDTVATVSLSWGGAGDDEFRWRYEQGKQRLIEDFGLKVKEMTHTLAGSTYLSEHPEARAQDLMEAFKDPEVKAILTCIGGDDSVRLLPFIDFEVIKQNPKIVLGYSDTTITHLMCLKAGITSFYGPSILAEFAENIRMFDYTVDGVNKALFSCQPIGEVKAPMQWTSEFLPWVIDNQFTKRRMQPNSDHEFIQGSGVVRGHLMGGCLDVLEMAKGSSIWPSDMLWNGAILFFETSEDTPNPKLFEDWLRSYGTLGILQKASGLLVAKPYDECYFNEYKDVLIKVVKSELKLVDLPIVYNMSFGHTAPMMTLPYGVQALIDCEQRRVEIVESGVVG